MTALASGSLRLDYTNALAEVVGEDHGLTERDLAALRAPARAALAAVQARRAKDLRWLDLPYQRDVHADVRAFAARMRGRFEHVVVLGIGGSALGTSAVHAALRPGGGTPRLHVLDNIDPDAFALFLASVPAERCLFNVISKSGGTAETMAQFLVVREHLVRALGEARHREHMVVTTDPEQGVMRAIVRREEYASFPVPAGVGGRFSVLSPVGLVPLALVDVDIEALLAGAARMDARCRTAELAENPALLYAGLQHVLHAKKRKPMAVSFAYAQRLALLSDWYAQLLGESLGKRRSRSGADVFTGPTPVRAVGVTDQHSQVQLYVEGPFDKWFTLFAVDAPEHDVPIPAAPPAYQDLEGVHYLGGHTLGGLFAAERDGTTIALSEARRPNVTLRFPAVTPQTVGEYLYLMELAVALMGEHYDVDAFDQPGVEAGKLAAYALMGRAGYEARRAEIQAAAARAPRIV